MGGAWGPAVPLPVESGTTTESVGPFRRRAPDLSADQLPANRSDHAAVISLSNTCLVCFKLFKVFGIGPRVVTSKMIEFLYK